MEARVPSRNLTRRCILSLQKKSVESNILHQLKELRGKVSFTADAWSSRVHEGYIVETFHWHDKQQQLYSGVWDTRRCPMLHTWSDAQEHI